MPVAFFSYVLGRTRIKNWKFKFATWTVWKVMKRMLFCISKKPMAECIVDDDSSRVWKKSGKPFICFPMMTMSYFFCRLNLMVRWLLPKTVFKYRAIENHERWLKGEIVHSVLILQIAFNNWGVESINRSASKINIYHSTMDWFEDHQYFLWIYYTRPMFALSWI